MNEADIQYRANQLWVAMEVAERKLAFAKSAASNAVATANAEYEAAKVAYDNFFRILSGE